MIWLWVAVLAVLTVAPLVAYTRRAGRQRGRQEAALSLHRAQLRELDRDLEDGRLVREEHEAAKLEVQRRLLADAALAEPAPPRSSVAAVATVGVLVPAAALALYLTVGHPDFPPKDNGGAPAQQVLTTQQRADAERGEEAVAQLSARLRLMEPHADRTLQGYEILGKAELELGHLPEAIDAFQHVLADRFEPTIAAETAEMMTEVAGNTVTPEALALFKRAMAAAPADAPWRPMARKRIAEAGG
jgi:cytochrome c-type biogenesis protein CcmH